MDKGRLEAFSDGVIAIIITIMVLELKVPHGVDLESILPLAPVFLSYILSFIYVGIYWSNHHHLLHISQKVNGGILWGNLHLLFWLSMIPFTSGWLGENHYAAWPAALYGINLMMCGFSYSLLVRQLIRLHGKNSVLARALGKDLKGWASVAIYVVAIPLSFYNSWLAMGLYAVVAFTWLVPDRRIEDTLNQSESKKLGI
jgi:uncharacterized membrane protein